jgi:hypothetical protein
MLYSSAIDFRPTETIPISSYKYCRNFLHILVFQDHIFIFRRFCFDHRD